MLQYVTRVNDNTISIAEVHTLVSILSFIIQAEENALTMVCVRMHSQILLLT